MKLHVTNLTFYDEQEPYVMSEEEQEEQERLEQEKELYEYWRMSVWPIR